MKWKIEVSPLDKIPYGYGVAWRHMYREGGVVMPIPLNLIVGGAIKFYYQLVAGFSPSTLENMYQKGIVQGKSTYINMYVDKLINDYPDIIAKKVLNATYQGTINAFEHNTRNSAELNKIDLIVGEPTAEAVSRVIRNLRETNKELNLKIENLMGGKNG